MQTGSRSVTLDSRPVRYRRAVRRRIYGYTQHRKLNLVRTWRQKTMPHDPKISTTNKTALLLIISLMLISCGDSISKNSKTWHIEDTEAQDHHIDNKEGTTKTDCVQQGSITIKWKDDLEKLKSFQCNTLDGSVYIELKEVAHTSLDRGENVSEINDIGNLKKVKGAIVFGELGPDERYLDSENTFSNQNPFLNKIHGFASLEMVETIILTDARGLRSLE